MKTAILLALSLVCCGWPNDPPDFFVIDSEFPEEQHEAIRAAFDGWCEAVGYCPTEALWADRGRVMLVDDLPEDDYTRRHCPEGRTCQTNATNSGGDNVKVARQRVLPDDMASLWYTVAHEIGHYCTEHTKAGLMAAVGADDREYVIDDVAVAAWRSGCP